DLAVVIIDPINDRTPSPISFDTGDLVGGTVTKVGYGAGTLQSIDATIDDCPLKSDSGLLCLQLQNGACKLDGGDMGAPSFLNGMLIGVTTFGDIDCNLFAADVRLSSELDFLGPFIE